MRLIISGANGFVGKHLVNQLMAKDILVDTLSRNSNESSRIMQSADAIIHLAGRAHVMRETLDRPLDAYMKANHDYALETANQAHLAGVKRFVYVSTIKVNGEQSGALPFTESMQPNPHDDYALSKFKAEQALAEMSYKTGLELVIIRPPLVYGANVKANFLSLLKLVEREIPVPLKTANSVRSMVYVENLVDALIVCATHPKASGETFLVSDNESVTVAQLIGKLSYAMGRRDRSFHFPQKLLYRAASLLGKGEAVARLTQPLVVDGQKIRNLLDWQPPFSLDAGLKKTADWYLGERLNR